MSSRQIDNIIVFGNAEESTLEQLKRCMVEGSVGVLSADNHKGYSMPIGGAVAYKRHISPSGVGYDIGCGNKAVRTNIKAKDVNIKELMDEIVNSISFGIGRKNKVSVDHPILEKIKNADFAPQRKLHSLATDQLGTVGSGNHYVDIFEDEEGWLWIGVHFGSRGFGHKTATGFIALSKGQGFEDHAVEGEMDSPPILFETDSELGQAYIAAMNLAGEYAYAGRDVVVNTICNLLGARITFEVHNHHNFAWLEEHFGDHYWVVRKGCTPAFPGQRGFVGANMADYSVILEGVDSEDSKKGLYSTVHGAGRIMGRKEAAGTWKFKQGKRIQTKTGKVDFEKVKLDMQRKGIELRGAGADEAPEVYKSLGGVLQAHGNTIKVLHKLKPLGVAMAGLDVFDPYKD